MAHESEFLGELALVVDDVRVAERRVERFALATGARAREPHCKVREAVRHRAAHVSGTQLHELLVLRPLGPEPVNLELQVRIYWRVQCTER